MKILSFLCLLPLGLTAASLTNFENGTVQGWAVSGTLPTVLSSSKEKVIGGKASMAVSISQSAEAPSQALLKLSTGLEQVGLGAVLIMQVWIPEGCGFTGVEPYSTDANGGWDGKYATEIKPGAWNTFSYTVPCAAALPLAELGIYLFETGRCGGTAYMDAVTVSAPSAPVKVHPEPMLRVLTRVP